LALPSDDTVTSIAWPGREKGGKVAVTITAAVFLSWMFWPGGTDTPSACSIEITLCRVKGVCVVWSPVPSRPTARP